MTFLPWRTTCRAEHCDEPFAECLEVTSHALRIGRERQLGIIHARRSGDVVEMRLSPNSPLKERLATLAIRPSTARSPHPLRSTHPGRERLHDVAERPRGDVKVDLTKCSFGFTPSVELVMTWGGFLPNFIEVTTTGRIDAELHARLTATTQLHSVLLPARSLLDAHQRLL